MLVVQLVPSELDHPQHRNLDVLPGRCHVGQHPVDFGAVGEAHDEFVDDLQGADGAGDRDELHVRRIAVDKMVLVEAAEFPGADAAGHGGNMVDVGLGDHGRHGGRYVAGLELVADVVFPQG
ncbi:hypothetical protein D3C75_1000080 [compost metagenome]